jgi:hypothetical protein
MRELNYLTLCVAWAIATSAPVEAGKWRLGDDFTQSTQSKKSAKLRHFKVKPYSTQSSKSKACKMKSAASHPFQLEGGEAYLNELHATAFFLEGVGFEALVTTAPMAYSLETQAIMTWLSFLYDALSGLDEDAMAMIPFIEALMQPSMQAEEAFDEHTAQLNLQLSQQGWEQLTYVQWLADQQNSRAGHVTPIEQEEGLPDEPSGSDNVFISPNQIISQAESGVYFSSYQSPNVAAALPSQDIVSPMPLADQEAVSNPQGTFFSFGDVPSGEGIYAPQFWQLEEIIPEGEAQQQDSDLLGPLVKSSLFNRRGRRPDGAHQ